MDLHNHRLEHRCLVLQKNSEINSLPLILEMSKKTQRNYNLFLDKKQFIFYLLWFLLYFPIVCVLCHSIMSSILQLRGLVAYQAPLSMEFFHNTGSW